MATHRLPDNRVPVLLSAHEEELIGQDAAAILDYLGHLGAQPGTDDVTPAVAATLLRTRRVRRHRAVVRAADRAELQAGLRALAAGEQHPLVARSSENATTRTAFAFPGQGNQWPSMGAEAYQRLPAYRAEADRCAQAFVAAGLPSPLPYLLGETPAGARAGRRAGSTAGSRAGTDRGWSQIDVQGAQFTHAASLAQLWRSCGVLPDLTIGHSLGEAAAAYVAGTITLADAVAVVAARATVVGRLSGRYGMAVLSMGADQAERLIAETPGWLEVSAVNSPSSSVVSGDRHAVAAIVGRAEKDGIFARKLTVDYPGHTSKLESLRDTLSELLPASKFLDAPVEFVGSTRGDVVTPDTDFTDYWYQNLRNTVRFDRAAATAGQRGAGTFVEMSAHPSLRYALAELAEDALIVGSGRRDEPVVEQLSANIAAAAVANPGYRWRDVAGVGDQPLLRGFPTAPMRAIHLWATPEPLPPAPGSALVVAYEQWDQLPPRDRSQHDTAGRARTAVAVVTPDSADDPLMRRLTRAVRAHPACDLKDPAEAEIAVIIAPALMQPDPIAAAGQLRSGAGQLDYRHAVGPRCRRVWLVTSRGEQVDAGAPVALPAQAALAAMHRSVGFEFPDQTFAHLDVPSRGIDKATAHRCVDVLLDDHTEVAVRAHHSGTGLDCFVRTLRESAESAPERVDAAALDHVVITGGNGTIGLRYARHCVEHGAQRVTLLSRNGLDRAELDRLTAGYPAQVHAPACDITDTDALAAVAGEYAGHGASLLIHAAGAARFAPHDQLGDQEWADVFSAKVTGLIRMIDGWPLRPDARILLCSSVSGVWGGYGHAGYAASNRMLDTVAAQLRGNGLNCMSVRWGLWQGTTIAGTDDVARIERSGLIAMDPDAAITASLGRRHGDPLILAADFDRLRVFFESQGAAMPFATATTERDDDSGADGDRPDQLSVSDLVRAEIAAAFSLDGPAAVDLNASLVDLGADSMLALDLRDRLRRWTGQSVPAARLLGGITGAELIGILQSAPGADGPAASPESTAEPGSTANPERREKRRERLTSSRD
ncbi:mycobactin polyketide synthase MbtD [Mycobacterium gastri]|uniref:mycobactin polyketide synthase MbtD n=1 Tax=Mycobacterium gastri TaxID=1777 RepID=UPI0003E5B231|nr:polyketide synthase [Mycobacterium gastri 'Wayne']